MSNLTFPYAGDRTVLKKVRSNNNLYIAVTTEDAEMLSFEFIYEALTFQGTVSDSNEGFSDKRRS